MMEDKDKRTSLIKKNIYFSFLIKGWGGLVIYLLVPITLKCLGEYKNGVWLTISSMLIWIDQFDIGLGNGLRNKLAIYMAENNYARAKEAISSAFAMLIFIVTPITLLLCVLINVSDVYLFLNVEHEIIDNLQTVLTVATFLVCSTFIFKFIGNFYLGLQLPAINNLLVVSGQTLTLIGTIVLFYLKINSLLLIAIINTLPPLLVYFISYKYTFGCKYKLLKPEIKFIKKETAKELLSLDLNFSYYKYQVAFYFCQVIFLYLNCFHQKL